MKSEDSQSIKKLPMKKEDLQYNADKYRDKKQFDKKNALSKKYYCERNSVLINVFKIIHIRTILNVFILTFLILYINAIAHDIMESETLHIGVNVIQIAFAKLPSVLYIWSIMKIFTIGVYAVFNVWAYQRLKFLSKPLMKKVWDYVWLTIFIVYQLSFIIFSTKAVVDEDLPIASSFIILMEQWRMIMKSCAFVRSLAPRFLSYKAKTAAAPSNCELSHYVYFLFAPTLVYCDSYPRTKKIRWLVVIQYFAQFGILIFCQAFVAERFIRPIFYVLSKRELKREWYIKSILEATIPSTFMYISVGYVMLHIWMNGWAEMLRFPDRLFQKDWWHSTSIKTYSSTWNVIVYNWLHKYIYKEMYETIVPGNRPLATFTVFFISAFVHDYTVAFACRYYACPTFLIWWLGFGYPYTWVARRISSNMLFWIYLSFFSTLSISVYFIEYYARFNCAPYSNYYVDLFLPRSWNCQRIVAP